MSQAKAPGLPKRHYRAMTVASIRERPGADQVEVAFLESARFYKLLRHNPAFGEALRLLREALARGGVLTIGLTSIESDEIEAVRAPTPGAPE